MEPYSIHEFSTQLDQVREGMAPRALVRSEKLWVHSATPKSEWRNDFVSIGIVGPRKPTGYGLRLVRELVCEISRRLTNVRIVSGGAFGIDAEAHLAALECGLPTVAWVVGDPRDPSPKSHRSLFEKIAAHKHSGLVCPERVLGRHPVSGIPRGWWIERNVWLVASCQALLVPECEFLSGTAASVRIANDLNIRTYMAPGSVFSTRNSANNSFISSGSAHPMVGVKEMVQTFVDELGSKSYNIKKEVLFTKQPGFQQGGASDQVYGDTGFDLNLLKFLDNFFSRVDQLELQDVAELSAKSLFSLADLLGALEHMVVQGALTRVGNRFERRGRLWILESWMPSD